MRWLDNLLVKKVVGLVTRRVLDYLGVVLVSATCWGTNVCSFVGHWLQENIDPLTALVVGVVMLALSAGWSFTEKAARVKEVKEQNRRTG